MIIPDKVKVYITGGYVRDRLLGLPGINHDYVVVGGSYNMMIDLGFKSVGSGFPVFIHPVSGDEFALARTEVSTGHGYADFKFNYNSQTTLIEDLSRRDLTINAMAREVINFNELGHAKLKDDIIDPFNGQQDLKNGVLRHTTEAFSEDPLRVLRVARFKTKYKFRIDQETYKLMRSICDNGKLNYLTNERILLELTKVCKYENVWDFFNILNKLNVMNVVFPSLKINDIDFTIGNSTEERLINILSHGDDHLLSKIRTSDYVKKRIKGLRAARCCNLNNPKSILHFIQTINGIKTDSILLDILPLLDNQTRTTLQNCYDAQNMVTFKSIPTSKRKQITGRQISNELMKLRIKKISSVIS